MEFHGFHGLPFFTLLMSGPLLVERLYYVYILAHTLQLAIAGLFRERYLGQGGARQHKQGITPWYYATVLLYFVLPIMDVACYKDLLGLV